MFNSAKPSLAPMIVAAGVLPGKITCLSTLSITMEVLVVIEVKLILDLQRLDVG
jgi:hypothetical protein